MVLDHIASGVLYLLWRRRRGNDGSLVSAKALHKGLQKGDADAAYGDAVKIPAVKKTLRQLKAAGIVEFGQSTKTERYPGPAANGYRLSADPPIIVWRATAAVVMLLYNHPQSRLSREAIIEEASKLGLTDEVRDQRLGAQEISDIIDWCLLNDYIVEREVTIDRPSAQGVEKLMSTTAKVDDCQLFLQKIVVEVKRKAASAPPSSPHVGGGKPQQRG
jgi:hypothetical protein